MILNGSVFCYPTETLYGIGCIYSNQDSITKIFNIKNRNVKQKMSLLFKDFKMLNDLFYINPLERETRNKIKGCFERLNLFKREK